jgi:sarcosine oxidase
MKILVIGAGVFGAWSAKFLADAGHTVTLVDAYGPANDRSSSGDHSRVIRAGYGSDEIYAQWASQAWADWAWLSNRSGQELITQTGAVFLGEPGNAYVRDTFATLTALNLPVERLEPAALGERFPAFALQELGTAVYETLAGVIRARRAVHALIETLWHDHRVSITPAHVEPVDEQRASLEVITSSNGPLHTDAYVFACGAWLPRLFPEGIGARIRPTRQEVLYFSALGDTGDASAAALPVWIDFAAGLYGLPDLHRNGCKVGVDRHGPVVDPDTVPRVADPAVVEWAHERATRRVPALQGARVTEARVCQYENTSSGDFIIDRHPQWPNCWLVGGGSGHGFKHGPSVGRHVAALVSGRAEVIARFSLAQKTTSAARAVY